VHERVDIQNRRQINELFVGFVYEANSLPWSH